jgi:putative intracellular protease/amidase
MRTVGTLIYPGFELLDVFGPMEMFGQLDEDFELFLVAEQRGAVRSSQKLSAVAEVAISERVAFDILLIPGGMGPRTKVKTADFLPWIADCAAQAEFVLTVCTGSAILAKTGWLDGKHATTNKALFAWATAHGPDVHWEPRARWVRDGNTFTSSGVSAGMDMTLAAIAAMLGTGRAEQVAVWSEYEWQQDASRDPFAKIYGLG